MAGIAGRVPLGAALRALLADVQPEGVITAARAPAGTGRSTRRRTTGSKGTLERPVARRRTPAERHDAVGRPGLRNATMQLDASEAGGEARIGLEQGALELPGVFDEPALPFDRLDAQAGLEDRAAPPAPLPTSRCGCTTRASPMPMPQGELSATWRTGAGERHGARRPLPGPARARRPDRQRRAPRARRATCRSACRESVRRYVGRAVLDGTIEQASLPRPRRPLGLSVPRRQVAARGRVPHRRQGRRSSTFAYVPAEPASAHRPRRATRPGRR